ncbi:MAG: hypothetical protein LBS85_01025 [Clostridiales Family XIII bacterium]|nr:hypothetical protein [Clostridiales Family XIII bacterium]
MIRWLTLTAALLSLLLIPARRKQKQKAKS